MEPKVKILKSWETGMKLFGVGRKSPNIPESFTRIIRYVLVFGGIFYLMVTGLVLRSDKKSFSQKLEAALFLMAGYPCIHKYFVFAARHSQLFKVVDRLNSLLAEIEDVYGPQTLIKCQKLTTGILIYYSSQFSSVMLPVFMYAYYAYHVLGDHEAVPYEMYVPFSSNTPGYVTWLCLYELSTAFAAFIGMCFGNVFFGALTMATILVLSKIRDHCEQLNPENSEVVVRRVVHWHSEIISIVEDVNRVLGSTFSAEYVMGCAHISFSGYIILKAGSDPNTNVKKNIVVSCFCFILPFFYAVCGHLIKIQNDKLCQSIYENKWWLLKPKNRVDLLLPSIMANRGITLNYRRLVNFDMTSYFKILKQSYSILTILKIMDKN